MDRVHNPFSPGAGSQPPEFAGRDQVREDIRIAAERIRIGNSANSTVLVGLRGVGKTVLLDRILLDLDSSHVIALRAETPESKSLAALLAPQLRQVFLHLDRWEAASAMAKRGLRGLAGFVGKLKLRYSDLELVLDAEAERGFADNGDLEMDLTTLFEQAGRAAQAASQAIVLFIDELQYVAQADLAALLGALHRCSQLRLPILMVAAGLPQLRAMAGEAKSYSERLLQFATIDRLPTAAAIQAVEKPVQSAGASFSPEALQEIIQQTHGYPYFLQEWGRQAWDVAKGPEITHRDVLACSKVALAVLDDSFFRVRFDRLTPRERQYIRAMAELGPGPHRSKDIAAMMEDETRRLGPLRDKLIKKGLIWSPSYGDNAFTVPLFDEYMKRIMPGETWHNE